MMGDVKMSTFYLNSVRFIIFLLFFQFSNLVAVDIRLENSVVTDLDALSLPVKISDVTGLNVISVNFEIHFNQEVIQIQGVSNDSSITSGWQNPIVNIDGDTAQILLLGTQPLEGSGNLVILHFEIVGKPGDVSSIEFGNILLNEGNPEATGYGCTVSINLSPTPFDLYAPGDGESVTNLPITFNWQTSEDTPDDQVHYTVFMSEILSDLGLDTLTTTSETFTGTFQVLAGVTYYWKVIATDKHGVSTPSNSTFSFNSMVNSIFSPTIIEARLFPNYPNPFKNRSTIKYEVPHELHVYICIYNIHGKLVKTLINRKYSPGIYSIEWDGKDDLGAAVPGGVYIYQIKADNFLSSKKLLLMR